MNCYYEMIYNDLSTEDKINIIKYVLKTIKKSKAKNPVKYLVKIKLLENELNRLEGEN